MKLYNQGRFAEVVNGLEVGSLEAQSNMVNELAAQRLNVSMFFPYD